MDDGGRSQRPNRPANQAGPRSSVRSNPNGRASSRPRGDQGAGGGLLSRYAGPSGPRRRGVPSGPPDRPSGQGLLSRQRRGGVRGAIDALTGQIRRATDGFRSPRHGEWKASDFDEGTLRTWDEQDSAPFEVPPDPDAEMDESRRVPAPRGGRAYRDASAEYPARGQGRGVGAAGGGRDSGGRGGARGPRGWEDDDWDASWETGTWDTGWATGLEPSVDYGRSGGWDQTGGFWAPGRGQAGYGDDEDVLAESLHTLAMLGAVSKPIGRVERFRLLMRRRPAAAAMLAFFLLGFMLTCCAPLIPLLRLGYDAADAAHRVSNLQEIFAGGTATIFNSTKLQQAKDEVDGITHDLYEINGAMNIAGAPLAAISPAVRNYRLLTRIGFDLTASADEGLNVAQTLLVPLQGGALSSDSSSPGITPADIQQARAVLADASVRVQDALDAYHQLDVSALPSVLQPNGKYGKYLSLLPTAQSVISQMGGLLDSASALLGVGQPANYLVIAMDRSELRPGGGFQGNYGILTLEGGKQSKQYPLALDDVYNLDTAYYAKLHGTTNINDCNGLYPDNVDNPPMYYWWWPYRLNGGEGVCQFDWGLRDSNLSPDFPFNARTAMQIAEYGGAVPNTGKLQGVISFTPELIEALLQPSVFGPITMPAWGNVTVTADNLEYTIHKFQLQNNTKGPRKSFTHDLGNALIAELKQAHGDKLKAVLNIVEQSLKSKALQIYLNDPRAELVLEQLGLASEINKGGGDGFFVVDANFGGNKANAFVHEDQTDYVTLLPDGGAVHHLKIDVTYAMVGEVFDMEEYQKDYIDLQRTYLPGDATILGYAGFVPKIIGFGGCQGTFASAISDCTALHAIRNPTTLSDVPGRSMVMGGVDVMCGHGQSGLQTLQDYLTMPSDNRVEANTCETNKNNHTVITHTQEILIDWYTPHAFTMNSNGHGTYSELVEKQAGANDTLTVYVDTSQLHAAHPNPGPVLNTNDALYNLDTIALHNQYQQMLNGKKPVFPTAPLTQNTTVTVNF